MGSGDCGLKPALQGRELGTQLCAGTRGWGNRGGGGGPGLDSQEAQMLRIATLPPKALGKKKSPFPKVLWVHEAEL